jgi:hypothetical protein
MRMAEIRRERRVGEETRAATASPEAGTLFWRHRSSTSPGRTAERGRSCISRLPHVARGWLDVLGAKETARVVIHSACLDAGDQVR